MFTESLSYAELNAWFRVGFFRVCASVQNNFAR